MDGRTIAEPDTLAHEPLKKKRLSLATTRSTSNQTAQLVCPLCYLIIAPAESPRHVDGKPAHEICWIGWRKRQQASKGRA